MGFNLGAFAGGAARGATSQQELMERAEENKANRGFRERQLKMQESDQAYQDEQRQSQRDLQASMAALKEKHYGPREVDDGETTQDDGKGGVVRIPKKKMMPASSFGQDTARDMAYMTDAIGLKIAKSGDASQLIPFQDWLTKAKATEQGKQIISALNGDRKAFDGMVTGLGGDPSKAKFDPEKYTLDLGNGKVEDVRQHLFAAGADKALEFIRQTEADKNKGNVSRAQVKHLEAEDSLVPFKKAESQARAANSYAGVALKKAKAAGGGGLAVPKAIADQVKVAATDEMTGKPNAELYSYMLSEVAGAKDPAAAMRSARKNFTTAKEKTDAFMAKVRKMNPEQRKAQFKGLTDDRDIAEATFAGMLGPIRSVGVASGNLRDEDYE